MVAGRRAELQGHDRRPICGWPSCCSGEPDERRQTGLGYDCHRFAEGRRLVLGGVEIEHDRGLAGHSDADVLTHAIIDALLGAAALGDIGQHFPDTDERYRDADSLELLRATVAMLSARGVSVVHVDATVVIERPHLAPVRDADPRLAGGRARHLGRARQRQGDARGGDGLRRARGRRGGAGRRYGRAMNGAPQRPVLLGLVGPARGRADHLAVYGGAAARGGRSKYVGSASVPPTLTCCVDTGPAPAPGNADPTPLNITSVTVYRPGRCTRASETRPEPVVPSPNSQRYVHHRLRADSPSAEKLTGRPARRVLRPEDEAGGDPALTCGDDAAVARGCAVLAHDGQADGVGARRREGVRDRRRRLLDRLRAEDVVELPDVFGNTAARRARAAGVEVQGQPGARGDRELRVRPCRAPA